MIRPRRIVPATCLMLLLASACARDNSAGLGSRGLQTVFDSTITDSVIARTSGSVPEEAIRRVVEELRIAPAPDDASLFGEISEFDVGADERLYVFDQSSRRILIFDSNGALHRQVGRQGAGPGEFQSNNGMVVLADGRLAQWDSRNGRVSFLSPDGNFLDSWRVPSGFGTSNGLRTDNSGALFIVQPVAAPREGEFLGRMGLIRLVGPGAVADSLAPPDLRWERIAYSVSIGPRFSEWVPTHAPRFVWTWHPDGFFVSVSPATYSIELSRHDRAVRIVRDLPAIPVPEDERENNRERITASLRQVDPAWTWRGPPIPPTKAPVAGLAIGRDGHIWVRVAVPSVEIPAAERDQPREGQPPPLRFRDASTEYEIFAADGHFLGRVVLPWSATFMEADGNRVWYLDRDTYGIPAVVRARIEPALR